MDDLWTAAASRTHDLILAAAEISPTGSVLAKASPGFETILRRLVNHVAAQTATEDRTRPFGPFDGLRRRGMKTLHDLASAREMALSAVDDMLDRLRKLFLAGVNPGTLGAG